MLAFKNTEQWGRNKTLKNPKYEPCVKEHSTTLDKARGSASDLPVRAAVRHTPRSANVNRLEMLLRAMLSVSRLQAISEDSKAWVKEGERERERERGERGGGESGWEGKKGAQRAASVQYRLSQQPSTNLPQTIDAAQSQG